MSRSAGRPETISDEDKACLISILHFMDAFRALRPTMSLHSAYTFVLVAMEEGLGVQEYAERLGVAQSVTTRNLLDLGSHNRKREAGLGLVMQRMDPMSMRRHQTFLTPEGRTLLFDFGVQSEAAKIILKKACNAYERRRAHLGRHEVVACSRHAFLIAR